MEREPEQDQESPQEPEAKADEAKPEQPAPSEAPAPEAAAEEKPDAESTEAEPAAEPEPAAAEASAQEKPTEEPGGEKPAEEKPPGAPARAAGDGSAPSGGEGRPRRRGRGRRLVCIMCADKMPYVDYKDFNFLRQFISDRGRIDSRRKSGNCAKHQRAIAQAIKRARHLALIPYTVEHIRASGVGPLR